MFLTKPLKATLKKYRSNAIYDDETTTEIQIKIVPYNVDQAIRFGIVTIPEATGYFITNYKDVKEGDQVTLDKTFTIIKIADLWQFNKVTNLVLYVK